MQAHKVVPPLRWVFLVNVGAAGVHSSIVDEDVGMAELALDLLEELRDGRRVCDVSCNSERLDRGVDVVQTSLDGFQLLGVGGDQNDCLGSRASKGWRNALQRAVSEARCGGLNVNLSTRELRVPWRRCRDLPR